MSDIMPKSTSVPVLETQTASYKVLTHHSSFSFSPLDTGDAPVDAGVYVEPPPYWEITIPEANLQTGIPENYTSSVNVWRGEQKVAELKFHWHNFFNAVTLTAYDSDDFTSITIWNLTIRTTVVSLKSEAGMIVVSWDNETQTVTGLPADLPISILPLARVSQEINSIQDALQAALNHSFAPYQANNSKAACEADRRGGWLNAIAEFAIGFGAAAAAGAIAGPIGVIAGISIAAGGGLKAGTTLAKAENDADDCKKKAERPPE